jgi:hypothetical protein
MKEKQVLTDLWIPGFKITANSHPIQELVEIENVNDQYINQVSTVLILGITIYSF